jgi:hypothetical protein
MQPRGISYQAHSAGCSNQQPRLGKAGRAVHYDRWSVHHRTCPLHHERCRIRQQAHYPGLCHDQEEDPAQCRTECGLVSGVAHTGSDGQILHHNQIRNPSARTLGSDNLGQSEVYKDINNIDGHNSIHYVPRWCIVAPILARTLSVGLPRRWSSKVEANEKKKSSTRSVDRHNSIDVRTPMAHRSPHSRSHALRTPGPQVPF